MASAGSIPELGTEMKPSRTFATLAIDGIYYLEASDQLRRIREIAPEFVQWQRTIAETNEEIDKIFDAAKTREEQEEAESLCIKIDRDWQSFDPVAKKLIQSSVVCQILCVACLEAHINVRAEETLQGKNFEEFDNLSIVGKWLFYSTLLRLKNSFDHGAEPFQSFQALVARRNRLVHYKTKREEISHPYDMPNFVERLGLDIKSCEKAVRTTAQMAKHLARLEGRRPPGWVSEDWYPIFARD
jgi:hypothetical protein